MNISLPIQITPELLEDFPELGKITIEILEITPTLAELWLNNHNPKNRKKSAKTVQRYAAIMKTLSWLLNGETICFDWDGNLLNGQHRLAACVLARTPFIALIVRGLNPKVMTTYDGGLKRKATDVLSMNGFGNTKTAGVARLLMDYEALVANPKRGTLRAEFEHYQVLTFCRGHPTLDQVVGESWKVPPAWKKLLAPAVGIAFTYLVVSAGYSAKKAQRFLNSLLELETLSDKRIDSMLQKIVETPRQARDWAKVVALLITGFNAVATKQTGIDFDKIGFPRVVKAPKP